MVQYSGQELKRTLAVSLSIYLLYFALFNAVLVGVGAETTTSEVAEAPPALDNLVAELPEEEENEVEPDFSGQAPIPEMDQSTFGRYQVQRGDSLYVIARMYGMTVDELKALNGLKSEVIRPGQILTVSYGNVRDYPVGVRLSDQE